MGSVNEVTVNSATFQNIQGNFGLKQDDSYHQVAQRGFLLGNRRNSALSSSKVSKAKVIKVEDEKENLKEEPKAATKEWVAPIKDSGEKNSTLSTKDIMAQHNAWLQEQVLNALNDQAKLKVDDKNENEAQQP
jgi:hypothetical protein